MTMLLDGIEQAAADVGCDAAEDVAAIKRRHWNTAERRALVDLTNEPGTTVMEVARTFGVSASQLYNWRRDISAGEDGEAPPVFARVEVCEPVAQQAEILDCPTTEATGAIVVDFPGGAQVRIAGIVDPATLAIVLGELGR
jgi:transposase